MFKKITLILSSLSILVSTSAFSFDAQKMVSQILLMKSRTDYAAFMVKCDKNQLDGLNVDYLNNPRDFTLIYINSALLDMEEVFTKNNGTYLKSRVNDTHKNNESSGALGVIGGFQDIYKEAISNADFKVSDLHFNQYMTGYNNSLKSLKGDGECAAIAENIKHLDAIAKEIGYK